MILGWHRRAQTVKRVNFQMDPLPVFPGLEGHGGWRSSHHRALVRSVPVHSTRAGRSHRRFRIPLALAASGRGDQFGLASGAGLGDPFRMTVPMRQSRRRHRSSPVLRIAPAGISLVEQRDQIGIAAQKDRLIRRDLILESLLPDRGASGAPALKLSFSNNRPRAKAAQASGTRAKSQSAARRHIRSGFRRSGHR